MRKLLFISVFVFLLLFSACTYEGIRSSTETKTMQTLSLLQALELAYSDALSWNNDAQLMNAKSVQHGNDKMDGKSRGWDVFFGLPGSYGAFWVSIRDGEIENHADISDEGAMPQFASYYIDDLSKIKFDSPELLKEAIKTDKLYSGDDKEKGYTYKVSKNGEENVILFQIIGWDERERKMKTLQFDASTGEPYKSIKSDKTIETEYSE